MSRQLLILAVTLGALAARAQEAAPPDPIEPPVLLQDAAPIYPDDAFRENVQGPVTLEIDIGVSGRVELARVVESPDPRLGWSALGAATNLVFQPARQGGEDIRVRVRFTITFQIDERERERALAAEEAEQLAEREETALVNFRGHVEVAAERLNVEGALVTVEGHDGEALTDALGYFELRGVPEGAREVTVEMAGFRAYVVEEEFEPNVVTEVRYFLRRNPLSEFETVVRGRRERREVAKRVLTQKELSRVPGTFGDAVRVVQRLPGVARAPFGLGAVVVRGGAPEDSAVHIDGHFSRILFHLGAGPSVVNTDLVEKLEFQPGGFGVKYGRATAGVIEVITRDPNDEAWSGKAQVDLLQTNFRLEGPVLGGAVFFAGRRSYTAEILNVSDLITTFVDPDATRFTLAPRYYDYQAKGVWKLGGGHKIGVSVFGSDDVLDLAIESDQSSPLVPERIGANTGFHRIYPHWRYRSPARHPDGTPVLRADVSPIAEVAYSENRFDDSLFRLEAWRAGLRGEAVWAPTETFQLAIGADLVEANFINTTDVPFLLPDERLFPRPSTSDPPRYELAAEVFGASNALYTEGTWLYGPLTATFGLRADMWHFYDQVRTAIAPRGTVRYELLEGMALKGAVGLYHQIPSPFELAEDVGNPDLPLEYAWQYDLGYEARLTRSLELDVHVFARLSDDLAAYVTSPISYQPSDDPRILPVAEARAYGAELLLRQHLDGGVFGWIAYTLLRSEHIEDDPDDPEVQRWHLTALDQTHILSIALSWQLPDDWELGAALRYVTGVPETFAVGGVVDTDTSRHIRNDGPHQGARLPPFFQVDLRVDKRFTFDSWALALFLDVQNATNQTNFEFFQYNYDFTQVQGFPGLPIIPVFGLEASF
jgi:TonB family protein